MRFTIEYNPTDRDIKEMLLLDKDVFNLKDTTSFSKVKSWYKKNNEIYTILKLDGVVVGYINFMPITKECYDKFRIGKYKDYMLTTKDITPFIKGEDNYCLAISVVIRKDLRDTQAIVKLWKGFVNKINRLKKSDVKIASVIADCVSVDGIKYFISNYNGKYVCNSKDWGKIYEGNISNKYNRLHKIDLKPLNKSNIKIAAKYQYEIFKDSNSVGYCDYLDEINNNNMIGDDWSQNYLIYYKGKPVGVIGLLKYQKYPDDIWLNWFGVMPKYRNKGIGTASLIKIIKMARKYNAKNFRLFTYEMWYRVAQNIYRKTMQLEENYLNPKDEKIINQQGAVKVYSISLCDKVCDEWDNKFLNLISESDLSKRSIKKLKEDGLI